jgi:hypothetical protein
VQHLQIKVGQSVGFPNNDPFYHNIFSDSITESFDLGSCKKGQTREVVFDTLGLVEVQGFIDCHPMCADDRIEFLQRQYPQEKRSISAKYRFDLSNDFAY